MRTYSRQEKDKAQESLPKPLYDFIGSTVLTNLYVGIQNKLGLDLRQLMLFSEIVNVTLMGLESESALETNLHQSMPELSNAATRELALDINDRIFKEAKRRVQENILTEEPAWDEEELGPKETYSEAKFPNDVELESLAQKEETEGWHPPVDPNEGPEGDVPEEETEDDDEEDEPEKAGETIKEPSVLPAARSVVEEKLAVAPSPVTPPVSQPAPQVQKDPDSLPKEGLAIKTIPETTPRIYPGGTDPYREPIE